MAKKNRKKQMMSVSQKNTRIISAEYTHKGPLPTPSDFLAYGEVLPDAPERILRMAEEEQRHRHEIENSKIEIMKEQQQADNKNGRIGLIAGIIIVICVLAVGYYLIINGKEASGWASIIGAAAAIITAFINIKKQTEAQK